MSLTTDERAAMIERAEREWSELKRLVDSFSDAQLDQPATCGEWSARDVMVHIANWEEELVRILRELDAGRQPAPTYTEESGGIDAWNDAQVVRFRVAPLAEARRYFEETHAAAIAAARSSPHMRADWLAGMYGGGHLEDLQALRARLDDAAET
jgi:uncharacterized protein (TIGR03083 family)